MEIDKGRYKKNIGKKEEIFKNYSRKMKG